MLRKIATGAGFVVVIAASGALLAARAAPQRQPVASPAAAGDTFAATCKANEAADIRPDPAWVRASFEGDHCAAPSLPGRVDGYTASREQVMAVMAAKKSYDGAADRYQKCVADYVITRKAQAEKARQSLDVTLVVIENHRIAASQNMKKQLAAQVDASINAFNEFGSECL